MQKKNIAVIFGGKSAEHDVSIITAHIPIIESLLTLNEYNVYPVYITKDGAWYSDLAMNTLSYFKEIGWEEKLKKQAKLQLQFDNGLVISWPGLFKKTVKIDLVFPAMHGTYGEDGSLMGLLRMSGVPFVGCDLIASAAAMDKVMTKQIVNSEGVPVVPYMWFTRVEWEKDRKPIEEKIAKLKFPLFIKPVHLGSSIGISKAKDKQTLLEAIEVAMHYDNKVLVEEGIENLIEVTLPIIGHSKIELAAIERPLNKTEFFDFKDKYLSKGGKKGGGGVNNNYSEIPAKIEPELYKQVEAYGVQTFRALGCSGIARVDFLIDGQTKQIFVNEVNTLPGSLYVHNWKKTGVSGIDLVKKLIAFAMERSLAEDGTTFTFDSDILTQVGGAKIG